MKIKYAISLCIYLGILLTACNRIGSRVMVNKSITNKKIKSIGYVIIGSTFPDMAISHQADSLLAHDLEKQLNKHANLQVVFLGNLPNLPEPTQMKDNNYNVDALLVCEAHLSQMVTHDQSKRYTTRVHTILYSSPEINEMASSFYDTKLGKSYVHYPHLVGAIHDGVAGVLVPIHKILKQLTMPVESIALKQHGSQ